MSELAFLGCRIDLDCADPELDAGLRSVYASVPHELAPSLRLKGSLRRSGVESAALELPSGTVLGRGQGVRGAGAAVAFALFHEVARLARDSLIVHAGAVELGGGAVLLVATSHAGKTTLTTALALRGAGFLSDEAAPLARGDRRVQPFPRAVGLRPGPLARRPAVERVLRSALIVSERGGRTKHIVDLLASGLARPGAAAPLRHVVFLLPAAEAAAPGRDRCWRIDVDAPAPGLAERLRALPGVRKVEELGDELEPQLRVVMAPGVRLARALDEAAAAEGRIVIRAADELPPPDYQARPRLSAVSASESVMRLARHLENGAGSALFRDEMGGNPGQLVFELARLVAGARAWELSPGELEASCDLVEGLA